MRDDTVVVAHKGPMLQNSESPKTVHDQIAKVTTIYASNEYKYLSPMKELFLLYNSMIDIQNEGFNYGSISLEMELPDRRGSDDFAVLRTIFYARRKNQVSKEFEHGSGEHISSFNLTELLREKKFVEDLEKVSFGTRSGIVTSDDPINVYQAIKDSQLDATKLFITLNKEGEDKYSVSKLDDFLGECLKAAQEALEQADASNKKKKEGGNLQGDDPVSGSQASESQVSSTQRNAQEPKKNRKALMDEFKQSLVSKDMAKCKESAKLLMANSTVSSLMYLFVLIALGVCLL
ncbi:Uncharacterized protein PCOAH_00034880 [Plasmodium coatneyi]|uniref:Uncharacterized protein n=1 Tax=Plasmodium coatneyi TaxID=208452 RepID=A0A1B1E2I9_9APIC|nr:Uncharacterized protein PCOAH_00034880 [Plasmodium coatneyi]ANQ09110.1 Uncharacterized protein PCOAH_00034880 [Plasmodium coatneyi]